SVASVGLRPSFSRDRHVDRLDRRPRAVASKGSDYRLQAIGRIPTIAQVDPVYLWQEAVESAQGVCVNVRESTGDYLIAGVGLSSLLDPANLLFLERPKACRANEHETCPAGMDCARDLFFPVFAAGNFPFVEPRSDPAARQKLQCDLFEDILVPAVVTEED